MTGNWIRGWHSSGIFDALLLHYRMSESVDFVILEYLITDHIIAH